MNHITITAILAAMSVVVALEAEWLKGKINTNKYFGWLAKEPTTGVFRAIYFLGFPALALVSGLIPARFFGLKGLEVLNLATLPHTDNAKEIAAFALTPFGEVLQTWMPDFGPMLASAALLSGLFFLYFWVYLTTLKPVAAKEKITLRIYPSIGNLFFDGIHWSFYRAASWLILGSLYLGIVGGLAVLLVEYALASRVGNFSTELQQQYVFRFIFGLLTTVAFFFAPNLWFSFGFLYILAVCTQRLLQHRRQSLSAVVL